MTLSEFHEIALRRKADIALIALSYIHRYAHVRLSQEELDDVHNDLVISTASKLVAGAVSFKSEHKLVSYLVRCWQFKLKADHARSQRQRQLDRAYYVSEFHSEAEAVEEVDTEHLYHALFSFVFARFPARDASLYKKKVIDQCSYSRLAEETGYDRNLCYKLVSRIEREVRANREQILASKHPTPERIYTTGGSVSEAITAEYRASGTTLVADAVFALAGKDEAVRLSLLDMPYEEFLELYDDN